MINIYIYLYTGIDNTVIDKCTTLLLCKSLQPLENPNATTLQRKTMHMYSFCKN